MAEIDLRTMRWDDYFKIKPFDLGPIYGPIDHYNLPVLGLPHDYDDFKSSAVAIPNEEAIPMTILEPGMGNLLELHLVEGDFMSFGQSFHPPLPALWCIDDCHTIAKLVYGQDEFLLPYHHVWIKEDDPTLLTSKDSLTPWFNDTLFGQTQFCIYYWTKAMMLFPERLLIGNKDFVSPEIYDMAFSLIENLKNLKAREAFTIKDDLFIRAHISSELKDTGKDSNNNDTCSLKFYGTALDFEIWKNDGDKNFVHERFTNEYSNLFGRLIYDLLPVYGRYNLLMTMFHGMHQIKNSGLQPSEKFFEQIIKF